MRDRFMAGDAGSVEGVGGETHEHFTGEGVVIGVEGRYRDSQLVHVGTISQP
ncbi:MAG: hypothetical protein ACRDVK_00115 [Acidimicrobiia bacterium]